MSKTHASHMCPFLGKALYYSLNTTLQLLLWSFGFGL